MAKRGGGFIGQDGINAPDQATGVSGTAGDEQVEVSFTSPSDEGGADITGYRVQSNDGIGASGSSSPITVTGLTNDTEYTFNVWAINAFGWSSPSDATGGLTPSNPRALFMGGEVYLGVDNSDTIDYITMASTGNAIDFGNLSVGVNSNAACSSSTRGVSGLFNTASEGPVNVMEYVTIANTGNATDFGDLTVARRTGASASNATRGLFLGGNTGNTIDYITIASVGNATDFGDILSSNNSETAACASPTRAICSGENIVDIWYVTIASTGNSTDFGDRTVSNNLLAACSSGTRGVFAGGEQSNASVIDYVTIASTGNATDFGDLQMSPAAAITGTSGNDRGVFAGGDTNRDTIEYITISTTGNAADFGNLTQGRNNFGSCSSAHGGLQ